jgi:hypothetical protein
VPAALWFQSQSRNVSKFHSKKVHYIEFTSLLSLVLTLNIFKIPHLMKSYVIHTLHPTLSDKTKRMKWVVGVEQFI